MARPSWRRRSTAEKHCILQGTSFSHWDQETFDAELMTGFISLGGESPLSVMSIGSMADLGYTVNTAAADGHRAARSGWTRRMRPPRLGSTWPIGSG